MSKHHTNQDLADYYAHEDVIEAANHKRSYISKNQPSASGSVEDNNKDMLAELSNVEEDECCSARQPYEDENGDLTIEARPKIW